MNMNLLAIIYDNITMSLIDLALAMLGYTKIQLSFTTH
jgi:hypothetical protein